jgi:hypothetical protein
MPTTLLHLVSEQTMQNLLPLLALRPATVVQVRSSDKRFARMAESLKAAVQALRATAPYRDLNPEFFEMIIDEASPDTDRTRRKVGEAISLWPDAVVNLTGGTKPMAIGAFLAAQYQHEPVLYCDTQKRRFVSLNEKRPLPALPHFDEIAGHLSVEAVMAAQGVSHSGWRGETPDAALVKFGSRALDCRLDHPEELLNFARELRNDFKPNGRTLRTPQFATRNLSPITHLKTPGIIEYLRVAAASGIVQEQADGFRFFPNMTRRDCEKTVDLLEGGWLELGVYSLLVSNARFGDVQWSLKPDNQDAAGFGETDLVAVDRATTGLALFSCKSTPPKLEHVEALRQRKETLGGRFARAVLCIAHSGAPERERLGFWCRALGVELLVGREIVSALDGRSPDKAGEPMASPIPSKS